MSFNKDSRRLIFSIFFVAILLIASTFAWIRIGKDTEATHKLVAGTLNMTLDESTSEGITLQKAIPIPYREGIKTTEYTFTLKNTGIYTTGYKISFENKDEFVNENNETITINDDNRIADQFVRFLLIKNDEEKEEENSKLISETTDRVIDSGILAATEENTYTLQVWLDYDAGDNGTTDEVMNRYFNAVLKIDAIQSDGTGNDEDTKKYALVFDGNGGTSKTIIRDSKVAVGEMPDSEREGYTFLGWFTDVEGGTQITSTTPIKYEKETYYAHWLINQYTVTFDGNGGSDEGTLTDDYHTELGALPVSTRIGYTFVGWFTEKTGGEEVTPTTKIPARNVIYYAHWSINQYRVSFDGNGGSDGADIVADYNTELGTLPDSIRRGYIFAGWFTETEGGTKITEHTRITAEDVTYYAHWIINFFDVIYDYSTNGGTSSDKETDVIINEEDIDLSPIAYKDGYEFVGWNTNKDATNGLTSLKMGKTDVTLYAIFRKKVTATFIENGATLSDDSVSCYIYNNGLNCTSEENAPTITRQNYVIKGFSTSQTSTDKEDTAPVQGQKFLIGLSGATYYAITSQLQTSTAYYYETNTQKTINLNCTIYNTQTKCIYPLPIEVTESSGPDETEYVGLSKTKSSNTLESEINSLNSKYYSVYRKNITSTFYYYDSGVKTVTSSALRISTTNESNYTTDFQSVSIPNEVTTSTGPNAASYSGVSKDKSSNTPIVTTSEYKKYYAFYNGTWTVRYSKDDNTVDSIGKQLDSCDNFASTNETNYVTTGINCNKTLPEIVEKRGYTKDGWYEGNTKVGTSEGNYTITKDVSLVAKAIINTYTVTYNATQNGGTTTATTATFDFNQNIDLSPQAYKDAYDFLGWNTNKDATDGLSSLVMDTNDVTLYAIFKKSTTISLQAKSATPYTGSPVIANTAVVSDGNATPVVTYKYYTDSSCETLVPISTGAAQAGDAPTDVGEYFVQAEVEKVDGQTAATTYKGAKSNCVAHTIIKKDITITWGNTELYYNGSPQAPTTEITSVIPGETLSVTRTTETDVGNYTSMATVTVTGGRAAISNYNVTNGSKEYRINKIDNTLELSANQNVIYSTDTATFTVIRNVSGGELTVRDDNDEANVSINNNTVTVSNLGDINAGVVINVTVTSAATRNYKQAEAVYQLTIIRKNPVLTVTSSKTLTYGTAEDVSYTYDGDGVVSCTSSNTTYVTCSVNTTTKKVTITPVQATLTPVNIVLSASMGTNYNAATNQTIAVTINKKGPQLALSEYSKTITYDDPKSITYTYDGDGVVSCASSSQTNLSCSVNQNAKTITLTAVEVTSSPITVTVSVAAGTNYLEAESKTINVTLKKANPIITLSSSSGSMYVSQTYTFNERANVAGKFTNTSANTSYITASPGTISVSANSNSTVTLTGKKTNGTKSQSVDITVYFEPTDTTNYNTISASSFTDASKVFTATVNPYRFKATFTKGSNVDTIESTDISCTTRNANTTCTVSAPEFSPSSGYISQGWTKIEGSASPNSVAEGGTITLSGDAKYQTSVIPGP